MYPAGLGCLWRIVSQVAIDFHIKKPRFNKASLSSTLGLAHKHWLEVATLTRVSRVTDLTIFTIYSCVQ